MHSGVLKLKQIESVIERMRKKTTEKHEPTLIIMITIISNWNWLQEVYFFY